MRVNARGMENRWRPRGDSSRKRHLGDRDDHHSVPSTKPWRNVLPVVLANYIARQTGEMARM